jgi:type I restriction enzyme S subunit
MTQKRVPLGNFVAEYSVRNNSNEDIPVYSVTNSQGFCREYFGKEVASKDKTTYKIVPYGYFAYNPSRINVGSVDWQRCEAQVIVSPLYNVFSVSDELDRQFLYYFLKSSIGRQMIRAKAAGSVRDNLKLDMLKEMTIPDSSLDDQRHCVATLDNLQYLIELRKKQLNELDNLVKARFVELFGDPVANPHGFDKVALSELADIKIGPFGSLLHKEDYIEGGHALLNPSHIIDGKVAPDYKLTVSAQKYGELSAYHLKAGDVVMGRRGEMGRCAVVPCDGYLCGTGSLMIRTKGEVTADYIQKIISFPSFKKTIEDMAVGQTMPNLNVPIVSNFQIIKPPIEVQKSYYTFVEQVDKSKVVESIHRMNVLFNITLNGGNRYDIRANEF